MRPLCPYVTTVVAVVVALLSECRPMLTATLPPLSFNATT